MREKAAAKWGFGVLEVLSSTGPRGVRLIWGEGKKTYLVGRGIVAEADVAVDAEVDVLEGELGDGRVRRDDLVGERGDVRLPVLEGPAVFSVVGYRLGVSG